MTKNKLVAMLCQMMGRAVTIYSRFSATDKSGQIILSNGQLTATCSTAAYRGVRAEYGKSTGIHCAEFTATNTGTASFWGVANGAASLITSAYTANCWGVNNAGAVYAAGTQVATVAAISAGGKIGIKLNRTAATLTIYINGTEAATVAMPSTGTYYPMLVQAGTTASTTINTGQAAMTFAGATSWKL